MPDVVIDPAKVLEPLTIKLEVLMLLMIDGPTPFITKLPTVKDFPLKSKVEPLIVSRAELLPKAAELVSARVPPLIVVPPV